MLLQNNISLISVRAIVTHKTQHYSEFKIKKNHKTLNQEKIFYQFRILVVVQIILSEIINIHLRHSNYFLKNIYSKSLINVPKSTMTPCVTHFHALKGQYPTHSKVIKATTTVR